jgi:sodium-dependent phosphate cotransporter
VFDPVLSLVLDAVGPLAGFALALAGLVASLSLFDRLFRSLETTRLRGRYLSRLGHPGVSFLAGAVLTALTTSVAFSLGVVVPLYNRGFVEREEILPFVLGASVGTLSDTLLAGLALGLPEAVLVVVVLLAVGTLFSLAVLAVYRPYARTLGRLHDRVLADRTVFLAFVVSLVAVPLGLVVL